MCYLWFGVCRNNVISASAVKVEPCLLSAKGRECNVLVKGALRGFVGGMENGRGSARCIHYGGSIG